MNKEKITVILPIILISILILSPIGLGGNSSFLSLQVDIKGNDVLGFPNEWSKDVNLTNTWSTNSRPSMVISGLNVHLFYQNGSNSELYYAKSINMGMSWDKNSIFTTNDLPYSAFAQVASSGFDVHVVWQDNRLQWPMPEVFYRHSGDNGDTWDVEFNLSLDDNKESQNPSIACSGQNVHVVWEDYRSNNQYNIYYKRSVDGGITWDDGLGNVGQDRQLTFGIWPATDVLPYIAADEDGVHLIYTTWTTGFGRWETMYLNSTDNGASWSSPVMLSQEDAWHSDGQAIAVNGSGGIHVVWWETKYGNQEIGYRNSTDNGATWNPEVRLTFDANHSQQPDIVVNDSHVFVTWMDDRDHYDWTGSTSGAFELYYKESFDGGGSWGPETRLTYAVNNSIQPWVAMNADYIHVAWTDNRTNGSRDQIFYKRYPDFPTDPEYNITLQEGWNLVSLPFEQHDESIDQALDSIAGQWDYIRTYNSLTGTWKSNSTYAPFQLNDFSTLNHKQGFWINITEPGGTILTCSGYDPPSTTISLYAGWNLVGYPSLVNETVANALWGTGADKVMVCDTSEPYQIKEVGPTYVMKPGEGYWVHVPADSTWIVNW